MTRRSFWVEAGRWLPAPAWWLRLGPLVAEFHLDRYFLGGFLARWYVGLGAGPFVVTVGKREWVPMGRWTADIDRVWIKQLAKTLPAKGEEWGGSAS